MCNLVLGPFLVFRWGFSQTFSSLWWKAYCTKAPLLTMSFLLSLMHYSPVESFPLSEVQLWYNLSKWYMLPFRFAFERLVMITCASSPSSGLSTFMARVHLPPYKSYWGRPSAQRSSRGLQCRSIRKTTFHWHFLTPFLHLVRLAVALNKIFTISSFVYVYLPLRNIGTSLSWLK